MLAASVIRKQYLVGHGPFHAGKITVRYAQIPSLSLFDSKDPGDTSTTIFEKVYVYDCGSESPRSFDRALRNHGLMTGDRTDLLFVSHLDSDHVNKIDRLMGATPSKVVVLPYLDSEDLAELLMRELDEGSIAASIREYVSDPIGWWRRRGADTVIFVEPGSGDDHPPDGGTPDSPIDPDRSSPKFSGSAGDFQARLTCIIRRPRATPPKGFSTANYDLPHDIDHQLPQGGLLAGCGSYVRLEWRSNSSEPWRLGDWILLPYVHPVEAQTRTAFREAIMRELNINDPDTDTFARALLDKLHSNRKGLVALYSDHFEASQNAISMSLYSGPERSSQAFSNWLTPAGQVRAGHKMIPSPVGWLGTGDSKLKQSGRRKPWLAFFSPFSSQIFILSLPHHDSSRDFHDEILSFDGLSLAVATTIPDRNRVASLEYTLSQVESAGKHYKIVDDRAESEFCVMCERPMRPT